MKWTGEARYTYTSQRDEQADGSQKKDNTDKLQFRLYPTAEINNNWHVKARLTASTLMDKDAGKDDSDKVELTYVYADGQYNNFDVKLGKMPLYSTADDGLVVDDFFSGAQVNFGKDLKATLEAGRYDLDRAQDNFSDAATADKAANYQGIELNYGPNKFRMGASYRHFNSAAFKNVENYRNGSSKSDDANIWSVGAGYRFDHNGISSVPSLRTRKLTTTTGSQHPALLQGSDIANKGTWGAYAAYRYLGNNAVVMPTYDTAHSHVNEKGWEVGATYVPFTNVYTAIEYFDGKTLDTDRDAKTLFGRVSFFF